MAANCDEDTDYTIDEEPIMDIQTLKHLKYYLEINNAPTDKEIPERKFLEEKLSAILAEYKDKTGADLCIKVSHSHNYVELLPLIQRAKRIYVEMNPACGHTDLEGEYESTYDLILRIWNHNLDIVRKQFPGLNCTVVDQSIVFQCQECKVYGVSYNFKGRSPHYIKANSFDIYNSPSSVTPYNIPECIACKKPVCKPVNISNRAAKFLRKHSFMVFDDRMFVIRDCFDKYEHRDHDSGWIYGHVKLQ